MAGEKVVAHERLPFPGVCIAINTKYFYHLRHKCTNRATHISLIYRIFFNSNIVKMYFLYSVKNLNLGDTFILIILCFGLFWSFLVSYLLNCISSVCIWIIPFPPFNKYTPPYLSISIWFWSGSVGVLLVSSAVVINTFSNFD